MKLGYQGIPGCYSEEVIVKFIGNQYETESLSDFESVFKKVTNNQIDYAVIPIENSLGGSLHINYDLLIKYNLKIVAEYNLPINHCLLCHPDSDIDQIKYITSHPQALIQCSEFIEDNNLSSQDFFDTAGAARFIKDNCKLNIAAIASKRSAEIYNLKILKENIQNKSINYTRFLLLSKGNKSIVSNYISSKTSISFSLNNDPGALASVLSIFSNNNINLTKIESRPNKASNNEKNLYQYLFYLDFMGNINQNNCKEVIDKIKLQANYFNLLGSYPSISDNKEIDKKLKIGIFGFGRFGQFLGKALSVDHLVWAHSRSNYSDLASNLGITFIQKLNDFIKLDLDCVIISNSIISFEQVLKSLPKEFLDNKLLIDVLSVKTFPKNLMLKLDSNCDILCTHPMFGPDSAKNGWNNLPFVYQKARITNDLRCDKIINFFKNMNCNIIEMNAEDHDEHSANSQFITHLTGRILSELELKSTPINTNGFNHLLDIMENTCNDSLDLFHGLYRNNSKSIQILDKFEDAIKKIKNLLNRDTLDFENIFNIISESGTSKLQKIGLNLIDQGEEILNFSIGEPDFNPDQLINQTVKETMNNQKIGYTQVEGLYQLRSNIADYLNRVKFLDYSADEICCTNGAKQALYQTILYLSGKKDSEFIIPTPYWTSYPKMVELAGSKPVFLETKLENNYKIDINKLENLINNNTVAIILCNPLNPTGTQYTLENLQEIANLISKYGIAVISDEIYELMDYYKSHVSFAKLNNMKPNTFTINGFSKGFAMSGYRLGYVAGPKEHIKNIISIQSQITSCASLISQRAGLEAIQIYDKYYHQIDKIKIVGEYLYNSLIKIPEIKCAMPIGGMTIFPDISFYLNKMNINSSQFCELFLEKYKIILAPGNLFGNSNNIRISYGTDLKKANLLIERLTLFLNLQMDDVMVV